MLIKMTNGGLVNYTDDYHYTSGCPTCDYGSEYITEIYITLTKYAISIGVNKMYQYALTEGAMMVLLLQNYNYIQTLSEEEFIEWLKKEIEDIGHIKFDENGSIYAQDIFRVKMIEG